MKAKSAAALFFALLLEKTEIKAPGYNFKWLNSQYYYNLLHFSQPKRFAALKFVKRSTHHTE